MVEGAADLASRFSSSSSLTPVFICLHLVPSVEDTQLVNEVVGGFSFVFSPRSLPPWLGKADILMVAPFSMSRVFISRPPSHNEQENIVPAWALA